MNTPWVIIKTTSKGTKYAIAVGTASNIIENKNPINEKLK